MAELDTFRVATVFAADAELDVRAGLASELDGHFHELADASLIDGGKRILLHDVQFGIGWEEAAGIVAAHPEGGLGEVVGAEAEELSILRNLIGHESASWDF